MLFGDTWSWQKLRSLSRAAAISQGRLRHSFFRLLYCIASYLHSGQTLILPADYHAAGKPAAFIRMTARRFLENTARWMRRNISAVW